MIEIDIGRSLSTQFDRMGGGKDPITKNAVGGDMRTKKVLHVSFQ